MSNSQIRKCFHQPYLARTHQSITIEVKEKEIKKCRNLANNLINVSHAIYPAKYLVASYLGIGFFIQNVNIFYCNLVNAVPCLILGKGTLLKILAPGFASYLGQVYNLLSYGNVYSLANCKYNSQYKNTIKILFTPCSHAVKDQLL